MDRSNDGGANGDGGADGGDGARRERCGTDGDPGDAARTAVAGSCVSQSHSARGSDYLDFFQRKR
jgi:hypothetical protein